MLNNRIQHKLSCEFKVNDVIFVWNHCKHDMLKSLAQLGFIHIKYLLQNEC